ncbi:uncharacterized protein LOC143289423 [Babylonia areolata]|uniref:uncharacterized protein LOC143289423 n=1 Tax=Babylonia areolata TaxID=304850 RepID=UPI003FCF3B72
MTTAIHTDVSSSPYVTGTDVTMSTSSPGVVTQGDAFRGGCLLVNSSSLTLVPDDSEDLVSRDTLTVMTNVKSMVVMPLFFFIGCPSNLLNLLVFVKHGLRQRINLCLFSLSLVDLLFLTFTFLMYVENLRPGGGGITASARPLGVITEFIMGNHLLGCFGFGWASYFVSTVIAWERCLCVMRPLKAGSLLKTRTVGTVLLVGVGVITAGRFAVTEKFRLVCVVDVVTGLATSMLGVSDYYLVNRSSVDLLDGVVYGLLLPVLTTSLVSIATALTVHRLKKTLQFRKESSSTSSLSLSSAALPAREVALTRMLIYLSLQLVVLLTPNVLLRFSLLFLPQLSSTGDWANLYFLMISVVEMCAAANSSLNIVIYVFCGSKYRRTVSEMAAGFCARRGGPARGGDVAVTKESNLNLSSSVSTANPASASASQE